MEHLTQFFQIPWKDPTKSSSRSHEGAPPNHVSLSRRPPRHLRPPKRRSFWGTGRAGKSTRVFWDFIFLLVLSNGGMLWDKTIQVHGVLRVIFRDEIFQPWVSRDRKKGVSYVARCGEPWPWKCWLHWNKNENNQTTTKTTQSKTQIKRTRKNHQVKNALAAKCWFCKERLGKSAEHWKTTGRIRSSPEFSRLWWVGSWIFYLSWKIKNNMLNPCKDKQTT